MIGDSRIVSESERFAKDVNKTVVKIWFNSGVERKNRNMECAHLD